MNRFFAHVNIIVFTQAASRLLAFVLSIVLARGLGPDARGDFALFVLTVTLSATLGTLGANLGAMYLIGKGRKEVGVLMGNGHFVVLVAGFLVTCAMAAVALALDPSAFVQGESYWLYAIAFPLVLEYAFLTTVLVAGERFVALNASALAQATVMLVIVGVQWATGGMTLFAVLSAWIVSQGVAVAIALVALRPDERGFDRALRPDMTTLREQVRVGLPGQAGNVVQRLNYRVDQYVVAIFKGRADVGYYAVATGVAEIVWWIANAVSMALLPRITRMTEQKAADITPIACRNTLLLSLVAAAGLAAVAPFMVPLLFGEAFQPAVMPLLLLLPGVVALAGAKVISSYFFSQAKLSLASFVAMLALVCTIVFDLALIPRYGIEGAAVASSIAYCVSLAASVYYYQRLSGTSGLSCLFPKSSDLALYLDLARSILRARRPAAVDPTAMPPAP